MASAVVAADGEQSRERAKRVRPLPSLLVQRKAIEAVEKAQDRRGQGFRVSPEVRRAIERRGMELALDFLKLRFADFHIEDVHASHPYDFQCSRGRKLLHVEVKAMQASGGRVFLTRNEVELARREKKRMALLLVTGVRVQRSGGTVTATGGKVHFHKPWQLDERSLVPIAYSYELPA